MKRLKLEPGTVVAGKYEIVSLLGAGWEGEVYLTKEKGTQIERTAKFFYPARNKKNTVATRYAKMLHKLRHSNAVIQYHHQEVVEINGEALTCLFSEYVEGELLGNYLKRQPGQKFHPFQATTILYHLALGIEKIHALGEYHGDLHSDNVFIKQVGIGFEIKLFDLFYWKDSKPNMAKEDVCNLISMYYECLGGAKTYKKMPHEIKAIICGRRSDLITKKFKKGGDLRRYIENIIWD